MKRMKWIEIINVMAWLDAFVSVCLELFKAPLFSKPPQSKASLHPFLSLCLPLIRFFLLQKILQKMSHTEILDESIWSLIKIIQPKLRTILSFLFSWLPYYFLSSFSNIPPTPVFSTLLLWYILCVLLFYLFFHSVFLYGSVFLMKSLI